MLSGAKAALRDNLTPVQIVQFDTMLKPLEMTALDIFIVHLPPAISRIVDVKGPATLDAAYQAAVRAEIQMGAKLIPSDNYVKPKTTPRNNFLYHYPTYEHMGNFIGTLYYDEDDVDEEQVEVALNQPEWTRFVTPQVNR